MLQLIDTKTNIIKAINKRPPPKREEGVSPILAAVKQRFADYEERIRHLEDAFECLEMKYIRLLEQLAEKEKKGRR